MCCPSSPCPDWNPESPPVSTPPGLSYFVYWPAFTCLNAIFALLLRSDERIDHRARKGNILLYFRASAVTPAEVTSVSSRSYATHSGRRLKPSNDAKRTAPPVWRGRVVQAAEGQGLLTLLRWRRREPVFSTSRSEERTVASYWSDERQRSEENRRRPSGL